MANPELPEAILLEIFSRLPTKSVGQCRCLSKLWRRDLSSTNFIKKHLITCQQTIQQENLALITSADSLHIVTSPFQNDEKLKKWRRDPKKTSILFGACNGLVLLRPMHRDVKVNMMLVNPITLQQVSIPDPTTPWDDIDAYSMVHGFGYDCYNDDYKVIILISSDPHDDDDDDDDEELEVVEGGDDNNEHQLDRERVTLVDVYSVKTGVWNRLDSNAYPYGELLPSLSVCRNGAFVNGAVHWLICDRNTGYYRHIAAFDLAKEVFHEIPFPAEFNRNRPGGIVSTLDFSGIAVIGECLSIVYGWSNNEADVGNLSNGGTDVWIMKEYGVAESWVRFHIAAHKYGTSMVPLCMVGDEQLLCYTERDALVLCDLKVGTAKKVFVGGKDTWYWDGRAFVDSLVSPREV